MGFFHPFWLLFGGFGQLVLKSVRGSVGVHWGSLGFCWVSIRMMRKMMLLGLRPMMPRLNISGNQFWDFFFPILASFWMVLAAFFKVKGFSCGPLGSCWVSTRMMRKMMLLGLRPMMPRLNISGRFLFF